MKIFLLAAALSMLLVTIPSSLKAQTDNFSGVIADSTCGGGTNLTADQAYSESPYEIDKIPCSSIKNSKVVGACGCDEAGNLMNGESLDPDFCQKIKAKYGY